MKTIEVTDKAAQTIEALRSEYDYNLNCEMLCKAFSALTDILATGNNSVIGAMIMLSEHHKLIEELGKEVES